MSERLGVRSFILDDDRRALVLIPKQSGPLYVERSEDLDGKRVRWQLFFVAPAVPVAGTIECPLFALLNGDSFPVGAGHRLNSTSPVVVDSPIVSIVLAPGFVWVAGI